MFSKSADSDTPAKAASAAGGRSLLSSDLHITGNVTSTGVVEVQGEILGDMDAKSLVIGATGTVEGKMRAESVEVRGRISGSVSCMQFTLRSTATAEAQVTYETLIIESGAQIEGKFKHAGSKG